jgi:hypothetical protein
MLIDANLRDFFWPFAVLTATHIKQRVPHSSLPQGITPFHLWFKTRPNLSYLRPFGTKCTTRVITNHLTKFQARSETGRLLGYAKDAKGYLIWVPYPDDRGGSVKVRRDVTFHDYPPPSPSPDVPHHYLPLWSNVEFPDRLTPSTEGENSQTLLHSTQRSSSTTQQRPARHHTTCTSPFATNKSAPQSNSTSENHATTIPVHGLHPF